MMFIDDLINSNENQSPRFHRHHHSRSRPMSSVYSSIKSEKNKSLMELTDEHVLRLLDQAIDQHEQFDPMTSKRYLPQLPSQTTVTTRNQSGSASRSAIEDLFQVFENNAEFITMGKRLLNKKRKLEQLRAQLNLPDQLSNEDTVKLLKLRERLKAKRRLPTISIESDVSPMRNESRMIQRNPSSSMPDLTKMVSTDTANRSSLIDLNASLNSTAYRKRRRKSLFRSSLTSMVLRKMIRSVAV